MTRRGCLVGLIALVALIAVPAMLFIPPMVRNNHELNEWKALLYEAPVPPGATVEDRGTEFGLLGGNGNHCDFLAWLVLRSDLSDESIETHYRESLDELEFGWVAAESEAAGRVRVELFDSREAGLDLRCH